MMQLMGLGAITNPMIPCNLVPVGDPYRAPGNTCAGALGPLSFDSAGNLVSAGSAGAPPTAADQASMFSGMQMFALGASALGALGALVWFFKR